MNTEINFLELKPKKYIIPLIFSIIFLLLLIIVAGVLFYQKAGYVKKIETFQNSIAQMETAILEKSAVGEDDLQKLQKNILAIQTAAIPNVELYVSIRELFPDQNQLYSYEKIEKGKITIGANFASLQAIANYISTLTEQNFVADIEMSNVVKVVSGYQATLTIFIIEDVLQEELGNDD